MIPKSSKVFNAPKKTTTLNQFLKMSVQRVYVAFRKTIAIGSDWLCAQTPCAIQSRNETTVVVEPFNKSRKIKVPVEVYDAEACVLEQDDHFVYNSSYPGGRIPKEEFDVKPIIGKSELLAPFIENKNFCLLLEKAYQDSYTGKGNTFCINIKEYLAYLANPVVSKLERIGDPVFNRTSRHTPPIPSGFERKDFEACLSFPAPIGIRAEDFAFPSEQNKILVQLLTQIFNCKNAPICPEEIRAKLNIVVEPDSHRCEWCGEVMNIVELNQDYCSKEHSVNFCHRDPKLGTKEHNVYIGHCSCNREQGGYSEIERVMQIAKLAKYNTEYKKILLEMLQ